MHPVELRERVTSPGGTTIRAIRELGASRRARRVPERDPGSNGPLARVRGRRAVRARDAELIVTDDEESAARRVAELLVEAARAGSEIALDGRLDAGSRLRASPPTSNRTGAAQASGGETSVACRPG